MMTLPRKFVCACLFICLSGCNGANRRPASVPRSAVWVDGTFILCSVEAQSKANHCSVYKDDTGEILADGLFVLNTSLGAADPSELHYAGYGHRVIYLEDARRLIQSVASERDPVNRLMNERLKAFASGAAAEAIDCNGIANGRKLGATSDCALRAFTDKKPFYLRYYQQGIDSFGFRGLAGDADGNIYEVDYDSMGWMRMNLPKGAQLLDDNHTFVMPCPKPTALRKEPSGLVTCSRPIV